MRLPDMYDHSTPEERIENEAIEANETLMQIKGLLVLIAVKLGASAEECVRAIRSRPEE